METVNLDELEEYSKEYPVTKLLYDSKAARVVLFCLDAGQEIPVHVSTSEVLMQVLKGSGSLIAGEEEVKAEPGIIVACAREEPHGMKSEDRMVVLATIAPRP
ncbi:MAG: cupin domain-containing protein [Candidatus Hydrothermarchaeota archaeon]|nr:cupin domain-containing protein [Candidatus Hydrothermarchaeota archaeon]